MDLACHLKSYSRLAALAVALRMNDGSFLKAAYWASFVSPWLASGYSVANPLVPAFKETTAELSCRNNHSEALL
jgi:hypothetical protein